MLKSLLVLEDNEREDNVEAEPALVCVFWLEAELLEMLTAVDLVEERIREHADVADLLVLAVLVDLPPWLWIELADVCVKLAVFLPVLVLSAGLDVSSET